MPPSASILNERARPIRSLSTSAGNEKASLGAAGLSASLPRSFLSSVLMLFGVFAPSGVASRYPVEFLASGRIREVVRPALISFVGENWRGSTS